MQQPHTPWFTWELAGHAHGKVGHVNVLLDLADAFQLDLAHLKRDERADGLAG